MVNIDRFDVLLINLNPTQGMEINKTRPCIVISPNEMNHYIKTIIIAPVTPRIRDYPTRISVNLDNKDGSIVLDQIRTIDKSRIEKKLGCLDKDTSKLISDILIEMFKI